MNSKEQANIVDEVYEKFNYKKAIKFTLERMVREGKIKRHKLGDYFQTFVEGDLKLIVIHTIADDIQEAKPHWTKQRFKRELTGQWTMSILDETYESLTSLVSDINL